MMPNIFNKKTYFKNNNWLKSPIKDFCTVLQRFPIYTFIINCNKILNVLSLTLNIKIQHKLFL